MDLAYLPPVDFEAIERLTAYSGLLDRKILKASMVQVRLTDLARSINETVRRYMLWDLIHGDDDENKENEA